MRGTGPLHGVRYELLSARRFFCAGPGCSGDPRLGCNQEEARTMTETRGPDESVSLTALDRLRGALVVLAATPRILQLVWRAHPRYATAALALNVVRGLNPLLQAWLIKLT